MAAPNGFKESDGGGHGLTAFMVVNSAQTFKQPPCSQFLLLPNEHLSHHHPPLKQNKLFKSDQNPFPVVLNLLSQLEENKVETNSFVVDQEDNNNQSEKSPKSKSSEPNNEEMIKTGSFKKLLSARSSSPD